MSIHEFEDYLTSTHGDIDGIGNDEYDAFMDNHIGLMVTDLDNFTDGMNQQLLDLLLHPLSPTATLP